MFIDNEKLKNLVRKLGSQSILVVGDLALDEMVYGDTERISREAPVIILQHTHTKFILGGASNAAHKLNISFHVLWYPNKNNPAAGVRKQINLHRD